MTIQMNWLKIMQNKMTTQMNGLCESCRTNQSNAWSTKVIQTQMITETNEQYEGWAIVDGKGHTTMTKVGLNEIAK